MGSTLADLEMATRHVVEGEARIREVQHHLAKQIERGQDTALSERLINTMLVTLDLMMKQKAQIERECSRLGLADHSN